MMFLSVLLRPFNASNQEQLSKKEALRTVSPIQEGSMVRVLSCVALFLLPAVLCAQISPTEGLRDNTPSVHAFVNARIIVAPGKEVSKGTLVVRNGVIEAVGESVATPSDARIWNLEGLTLYPGLIDLYSDYGVPKPQPSTGGQFGVAQQRQEQPKGAAHWNVKAKADFEVASEFHPDAIAAEKLRSQGFTLVHVIPQQGIFRGQTAIVTLANGPASSLVVKKNAASAVSFYQGGFGGYPNSLMGIIAFIRQTWIDADWYRRAWDSFNKNPNQKRPETNNSLAVLTDAVHGRQPVVMEANDDLSFLRAARIGKERSLKLLVRGSGEEYRRLEAVKASMVPIIVSVNFPDPPSVELPEEALNTTLEELQHWDAAPENPARLSKAGVPIALTTAELKDDGAFLVQVRKAVERGLSREAALAALTTNPAKWMGIDSQYGSLEKGKTANFVVTEGDLFSDKGKVREVWIDGRQYEVKVPPSNDARGVWDFQIPGDASMSGTLTLKGDIEKPSGTLNLKGKTLNLGSVAFSAGRLSYTVFGDSVGWVGSVAMSGTVGDKEMYGFGSWPDGGSFNWNAERKEGAKVEADTAKPKRIEMASFPDVYPPGEFGREKLPEQPQNVLIRNATIWTQGKQGRIENADMLVARGKITQVGKAITAPKDAVVIDATGKHLTPGLIDCHSHTAAASINEGGQAITCETRIEDVLNSDDIWIYRQLAGGTTMANVLHGSANPIGGQNSVVKWRWGSLPEDLLMQGAPAGVKFALGENVKRSNSTLPAGTQARYPATRMGVEQIIRDRFKAAQDYERVWKDWEKDRSRIPPRRDLELDALAEMLSGKRLTHSHSYRQDEILMLIRVAEEFGIKIATFQHVLEGYKVAEVIAKHGAGASTFSDWWAYKMEVWDAIPGNGPLMHKQGVVVSYNSDNSQLASRLNWEAAKTLEYGLSEEEALNFVTMNPARQLKIDGRVGSLEPGKDADFTLWSGNPLSTFTKCEQTWVDGKKYFDLQENEKMEKEIERQRAALVQKILKGKREPGAAPAGGVRGPRRPNEEIRSCIEEFIHEDN